MKSRRFKRRKGRRGYYGSSKFRRGISGAGSAENNLSLASFYFGFIRPLRSNPKAKALPNVAAWVIQSKTFSVLQSHWRGMQSDSLRTSATTGGASWLLNGSSFLAPCFEVSLSCAVSARHCTNLLFPGRSPTTVTCAMSMQSPPKRMHCVPYLLDLTFDRLG